MLDANKLPIRDPPLSIWVTRPERQGLDLSKQPPTVRLNKELGSILTFMLKKKDGEEMEGGRDSSPGFYTLLVSLWKQVAEFTKYYVQPCLGESRVGGAIAVYGVVDAICSLAVGRFTSGLSSITLIVSGGAFL
nr:UNC93-like protein 3 [Tanacetum cinerariifolium]